MSGYETTTLGVEMTVVLLILLIAAVVCFALAAFNAVTTRLNLIALGLFFATLVPLIRMFVAVVD